MRRADRPTGPADRGGQSLTAPDPIQSPAPTRNEEPMSLSTTTGATYQVLGMPTLVLFVGGEIAVRFMGAKPRSAILSLLEPHLQAAAQAEGSGTAG